MYICLFIYSATRYRNALFALLALVPYAVSGQEIRFKANSTKS